MPTPMLRPTATVNVGAEELKAAAGTVTLDLAHVPYATASVEIPLIDPADIELLDPRDGVRVTLTAGDEQAGTSRVFDLGLRSREVDHGGKTITLGLASDEAMLMEWAALTADGGAREHEGSLRAVCGYVLDKIGATLAPGDDDADVTARWSVTSMIPNPRAQNDTSSWAAGDNANAPMRIVFGTLPPVGGTGIGWNPISAGHSNIIPAEGDSKYTVTPGRWYVFDLWAMCNQNRTSRAAIQWWTSGGDVLSSTSYGDVLATGVAEWQRRYVIAQCPPGADKAYPYLETNGNLGANAEAHYVTMARFYAGNELVDYFDGDTTDTADYVFSWANDAHASTCTREAVAERTPDSFVWAAGVTAWDFLSPLTSSVGLRLFCDEQRVWRLIDPATYTLPGVLTVAGYNATEGVDRIDREDPNVYCTGVVARYRWEDADGIQREETDSAGEPGLVLVWEFDRPYPGPGAAAAILSRRSGAGRVQQVTALASWGATPGTEAAITLPATVPQRGTLQEVTWNLATGLMSIGTSGLVDVIPGSIDSLEGPIDALAGPIDEL